VNCTPSETQKDLAGRRVLVVGAGTLGNESTYVDGHADAPIGNGRAIAISAARAGAIVVCADRVPQAAALTAERITEEGGHAGTAIGDVTSESDCAEIVAQAGPDLHGLVLNVGVTSVRGLANTSTADWDTTLAINLRSHFLITRAAAPQLTEGSSIVFIGSSAGLQPGSGEPAYDASKAGLLGLCRQVAMELGPRGVRANLVAPGVIDTPLAHRAWVQRGARPTTQIPLGRIGTPWEVAAAVVFLLSPAASYVTGQVLAVDGGLSMRLNVNRADASSGRPHPPIPVPTRPSRRQVKATEECSAHLQDRSPNIGCSRRAPQRPRLAGKNPR
jgi:NAD(P)-dependent dehydrogenase (short-subunit alcohol dehydrogenase family)